MLDPRDALRLPAGVRVDGATVVDDVRGAAFPANQTALLVLARPGLPLHEIAAELGRRYGLDPERARDDVLRFADALNRELLANVVRHDGRLRRLRAWIVLALRLAPAGVIPGVASTRTALDTSTAVRAVLDVIAALRGRASGVSVAAMILAAPGRPTLGALTLGLGVGAGLAIHEAGHAAVLAGIGAALVVCGARTYVLHAPLPARRRRCVAVAGPLAAASLGTLAVGVAWLVRVPELALLGCAPAAHALGLTVATGDGRAACGL